MALFLMDASISANTTSKQDTLVDLAIQETDHTTQNFLQWFVTEQLEEVPSMETLLSVVRRAGESGLLTVEAMLARTSPAETLSGIMERDSLCCVCNRCGFDIKDSPQAGERVARQGRIHKTPGGLTAPL